MSLVMPTRVLIVGSGGREHALAWKLVEEPGINEVFVTGDAMATLPRATRVVGDDVVALARQVAAELVVIGPEVPLAAGLVDDLAAVGIAAFGPSREAARIETSKGFCREIAGAAGVPMARGRAFAETDPSAALAFAMGLDADGRVVVKADGLAAGKGVTVCDSLEEVAAAISGQPGPIVIEERLEGREASVIALCDGVRAVALPLARDHKRLLDGDRGPNTGGMGAYSPLPDLPDDDAEDLVARFHRPVLAELARRGTPFRGALYAGLMLTTSGPRLLEFNARFGDPETQVLLPRIAGPLGPWLLAAARGRMPHGAPTLPVLPGATVGIVLAGGTYPTGREHGERILGLDRAADDAIVFHGGTRRAGDGGWETDGGRILTIVGRGRDLAHARERAEAAADAIGFAGMQRRHDIGLAAAEPAPAGAAG